MDLEVSSRTNIFKHGRFIAENMSLNYKPRNDFMMTNIRVQLFAFLCSKYEQFGKMQILLQ